MLLLLLLRLLYVWIGWLLLVLWLCVYACLCVLDTRFAKRKSGNSGAPPEGIPISKGWVSPRAKASRRISRPEILDCTNYSSWNSGARPERILTSRGEFPPKAKWNPGISRTGILDCGDDGKNDQDQDLARSTKSSYVLYVRVRSLYKKVCNMLGTPWNLLSYSGCAKWPRRPNLLGCMTCLPGHPPAFSSWTSGDSRPISYTKVPHAKTLLHTFAVEVLMCIFLWLYLPCLCHPWLTECYHDRRRPTARWVGRTLPCSEEAA